MITIHNDPIQPDMLKTFDTILKATGGYYLENPRISPDKHGYFRVSYYFDTGDYKSFQKRWKTVNTVFKEKEKIGFWKKLFAMFG